MSLGQPNFEDFNENHSETTPPNIEENSTSNTFEINFKYWKKENEALSRARSENTTLSPEQLEAFSKMESCFTLGTTFAGYSFKIEKE